MDLDLRDTDFVPLSECRFQHWGERDGPPFSDIRPLSGSAAQRVWARISPIAAVVSSDAVSDGRALDLAASDDWDASTVSDWLRSLVSDGDERVLVCYQPGVVVSVPWDTVCAHWLVFFWTGACVYAPRGAWALVHDGDRFSFGRVSATQELVYR